MQESYFCLDRVSLQWQVIVFSVLFLLVTFMPQNRENIMFLLKIHHLLCDKEDKSGNWIFYKWIIYTEEKLKWNFKKNGVEIFHWFNQWQEMKFVFVFLFFKSSNAQLSKTFSFFPSTLIVSVNMSVILHCELFSVLASVHLTSCSSFFRASVLLLLQKHVLRLIHKKETSEAPESANVC